MEQQNVSVGYINIYEYEPIKGLKVRHFRAANGPWVDFVHNNRTIENFNHNFDIVDGPVANDNVYLSFNLYESGIISKTELIRRLKTYKLVDQFLFHTEQSLAALKYKNFNEIKL